MAELDELTVCSTFWSVSLAALVHLVSIVGKSGPTSRTLSNCHLLCVDSLKSGRSTYLNENLSRTSVRNGCLA